MDSHYLTPLFAPRSIVVFAGTDETAAPPAQALLQALKAQRFEGSLQFVSTQTRGTLADLMQIRADLAIIALPAAEVSAAIDLAARMACKAVTVLCSGVDGEQAAAWHKQARREGLHLLGPNGLGFQRPSIGLNASTLGPLAEAGPLALVSQSGSLTAAMLDWAAKNAVAFSSVVALGPHASVGLAEALDFLANDPRTQSILVHMEGIADARRFMSALRSAANAKPVIVLKAGRRLAGQAAAAPTARRWWAMTMCSMPPCAVRARFGCVRSTRCFQRRSAWPRGFVLLASGWPSSPTGAGPGCWPPIGSMTSA